MRFIYLIFLSLIPAVMVSGNPAYKRFELLTASTASHSRSKQWKPGDGIALEVSGMEWMDDLLYVANRKGEVWVVENALSENREEIKFRLFASGLHEPLGLLRDGDDLLVTQRAEVTRLQDRDRDGVADSFLTECDGWNVSGNYHAYAYGPERDGDGNLWVTLNLGMGPLADNKIGWRGWGGHIGKDGSFIPKALGMRSPCGLGSNLAGDMFFTDQQGTWIPATPIYHLRPGVFYGNQESLASLQLPNAPFQLSTTPKPNQLYGSALAESAEFVPPAVWLPYNKMGRSATDIQVIDQDGKFGPFDGQLLVGEFTNASINRVFLEKVDGEYQGACFPFIKDFPAAVVRLIFAADGSLFAGLSNRGWSSLGNRSYGLDRITYLGNTPFEMKEIHALPDGFSLHFTKPIDPGSISVQVNSFTYEYSSRYGGDEKDTRNHTIPAPVVSADGLTARIKISDLRENYVFEFLTEVVSKTEGESLVHPNAWYTLNRTPNFLRAAKPKVPLD